MFSLALTVEREEYLLAHLDKNCSFLWPPVAAFRWDGGLFGSVMEGLAFVLKFRMWLFPFGLIYSDAVGETSMYLHKAASDYLVSASITIHFMWTKLSSISFFPQTDCLHAVGHRAVCDFKSVKSHPFYPHLCLFL